MKGQATGEAQKRSWARRRERPSVPPFHRHETQAGAVVGALAGAAVGAIAGPAGLVTGTAVGALLGAAAGRALDASDAARDRRDRELDEEIGIAGGDMGAAPEHQPPPYRGTYSSASAGVSTGGGVAADGPIPPPED